MRYQVLATDYDGTLAQDGRVDQATVSALRQFLDNRGRLVLVTGRELPEVLDLFPEIAWFEWVVAENGALLYHPATGRERALAAPLPGAFVELLRAKHATPLSVGRVIVATREPFGRTARDAIRDLGLDAQVILNKGAVMVLPSRVDKATGLAAALVEMSVSAESVAAVGDAENDLAFMRQCGFSAAVSNAIPMVKDAVNLVTLGHHGAGVAELISRLITNR